MLTQEIVNTMYSFSDVSRYLNFPINGTGIRKAKQACQDLDTSHFGTKPQQRKYPIITKYCPICNKEFITLDGHSKEKVTCSHACSNSYFRSKENNPNWKESAYRSSCFLYHGKQCWICGETNIVEVHHINEDKTDNSPENLAPLCPTHHQYWHSRFKYLVEEQVYAKIAEFKQKKT